MMKGASISEILQYYAEHREVFYDVHQQYIMQPLIMHKLCYNRLRDYSLQLLPQNRDVLLCFEHIKYDACRLMEVKDKCGTTTPTHCIILQVKFLHMKTYFNVGTIGYKEFTHRGIIAECIKEYIEDCFRADVRVLATCSSGQFEILNILTEMPIRYLAKDTLISYAIRGRRRITHIFDPSWLLRKLRGKFYLNDVTFNHSNRRFVASYDNVQSLLNVPRLCELISPEIYDRKSKSTLSAVKTFSSTTSVLIEDGPSEGTKFFLQFFDQLFDTFNATADHLIPGKFLRYPLTATSQHWELWDAYVPILNSMRFNSRAIAFLKQCSSEPKRSGNKQREKNRRNRGGKQPGDKNAAQKPEDGIMQYYNDNEYKRVEAKESNSDLVNLLASYLSQDKGDRDITLPEYLQDAGAQLKDTCIARSIRRAEAFVKELASLKTRINVIKLTSPHATLIKNVLVLLNTATVYNEEIRFAHARTFAYEYLSCKLEVQLQTATRVIEDTAEYYAGLVVELTKLADMLRFLNTSVFQCWLSAIAGVRRLFDDLSRHHCQSLDTKLVNCDTIHTFVHAIRKENGLPEWKLVNAVAYGEVYDYTVSILALTEEFNHTITTSIFDMEPPLAGKKKNRRASKKAEDIKPVKNCASTHNEST